MKRNGESVRQEFAHPWHGTNVILVTMRDDDCLNLVPPSMQEAGVWKDLLHAQISEAGPTQPTSRVELNSACMRQEIWHFLSCTMNLLWEHEACINENISVSHAHQHAVHAYLAKTPNGQDP